jgi:hypothetical protein
MQYALVIDCRYGGTDALRQHLPTVDPESRGVHIARHKFVIAHRPGRQYV